MAIPPVGQSQFLNHALSNLTPETLKAQEELSFGHRVKAVAIPVVFTIGVIGASVTLAVLAPGWIGAVGVVASLGLSGATASYKYQTLLSKEAKELAGALKEIQHEFHILNDLFPADYRTQLVFLEIFSSEEAEKIRGEVDTPHGNTDTKSLCALVAHYKYYKEHSEKLKEENRVELEEAKKKEGTPEQRRKYLFEAQCEVLKKEQKAFVAKAQAAFIRAVIHNRSFNGMPKDLYQVNTETLEQRLIALGVGDEEGDDLISFGARHIEPITTKEMRRIGIKELSEIFLNAMSREEQPGSTHFTPAA